MNLFNIQDPSFSDSYTLHEALLKCCEGAKSGGAAFAFVTKKALEIVMGEIAFTELLEEGRFTFIAGVDEITNELAVRHLNEMKNTFKGFCTKSFVHNESASLFHPKFCWFKKEAGGVLLVGSGNFTVRGLRRNREAFTIIELDDEGIKEVEEHWNKWLTANRSSLEDVLSEESIKRARRNSILFRKKRRAIEDHVESKEQEEDTSSSVNQEELKGVDFVEASEWSFDKNAEILVAEIPKSGSRWKQVNFSKKIFEGFFGATPGDNSQRILLRSVRAECVLGDIENRQSVSVKSKNYRFELKAAEGLEYPESEPPIGVFVKLSMRTFIYVILMPSNSSYKCFEEWLDTNWRGRSDRMKRIVTTADDISTCIEGSHLASFLE